MNRRDLRYLLLIFVVIIAAYAQLAFGIFSTKWDNLSAFFPYRYTVSEWINSGHLPLWDPYQNLGYPMHANPQGAAWNPFLWIVSLFTTYTPYIMNLEVVFYLLLAGFGFYLLLREFRIKHIAAVISALAYALSGFSSGTLHMIGFTAAAGLLPWCILYLYRVLKEPNYVNVIPLVISVTFHLVAAYPAFSIILTYLFTGFTLYYLISVRPSRPKKYLILLSKNLILATILILCLSSPFIYSIIDSLEYFSRAEALNYDPNNFANNFKWTSFITFITPYVIVANPGLENCDVSLTNTYIGFLPFLLSIVGIVKYGKVHKALIMVAILAYLLALGNYTPVHEIFFKNLPGFSYFRHPYLFTVYSIPILLFFSAKGFEYLKNINKSSLDYWMKIILLTGVIVISILLYETNWGQFQSYLDQLSNLNERTSLNNFGHAAIQLCITGTLFIICFRIIKTNKFQLLWIPIFLELIIAVQLNGPLNMYYNVPLEKITESFNSLQNKSLTNQNTHTSLLRLSNDSIKSSPGFWVNLNTYQRTTGIDGYNPFIFNQFDKFNSSTTFLNEVSKGLIINEKSDVEHLKIAQNEFSFINNEPQKIIINHNFHHNWKCKIGNDLIPIKSDKYGRIQIPNCTPGLVKLTYFSTQLRWMLFLSVVTLILLLSMKLFFIVRNQNDRRPII